MTRPCHGFPIINFLSCVGGRAQILGKADENCTAITQSACISRRFKRKPPIPAAVHCMSHPRGPMTISSRTAPLRQPAGPPAPPNPSPTVNEVVTRAVSKPPTSYPRNRLTPFPAACKVCAAPHRSQQSRAYFISFEGEAEEKGLCQTRREQIRQTTLGRRNPSHCSKKIVHK